jgi:hypothetical protein
MTTIYENTSFKLYCDFYDTEKVAIKPDSLTYQIVRIDTGEIIREETTEPESEKYTVEVGIDDNSLAEGKKQEARKLIVHWVYLGVEGDTIVFPYTIKKP